MDLIREINEKYSILEAEVDKKLEKVRRDEEKLAILQEANASAATNTSSKILSYEESLQRNANILKSLEMAKARLRSRSTYSPVEQILQKALENYMRDLETSCSKSSIQQDDSNVLRNEVTQQQREHHAVI